MFYKLAVTLARIFLFFAFRIERVGNENEIENGGIIYAANHMSCYDPVVIAATSKRQIAFMGKKELFKFKPFGYILKSLGAFPVNRGKGDIGAVKTGLNILKQDKVMMLFPEGKRIDKGEIVPAKPGVAMFATHAKVPVLPIKICGDYKFMHKIKIIYGKPIYFDEYYGQKLTTEKLTELSQSILDNIYSLEETK
ncbi:MAG: 1-acyl-sn-glycerol-3-phosphate acyltransferase [Clostridia bacterium]|nr:1-acyl-sn-glycerol-3-phosphate acyltransferase [Clostridia bacterium]MBR0277935.1 1-acyl-sn-glycerol-3-phosphate acyltransferase [Clostridia bacterium]